MRGRDVDERWITGILQGKFSAIFQEVVEQAYLAGGDEFEEYDVVLERSAIHLYFGDEEPVMSDAIATSLRNALESDDRLSKIRAALVCMRLAYADGGKVEPPPEKSALQAHFQSLSDGLSRMLNPSDVPCALASSWALAWIGKNRMLVNLPEPEMLLSLYRLWRQLESKAQARYPTWALAAQQLLPRDTFNDDVWGDCDLFLWQRALADEYLWLSDLQVSALVVGWYRRAPWNDVELVEQLSKGIKKSPLRNIEPTVRELLESLGDAGRDVLHELERKRG